MTFVKEGVVPSVMYNGFDSKGLGCRDAFKLETWGLEGLKSDDPNFCNLCVLGAAIAATLYLIFGCEPAHGAKDEIVTEQSTDQGLLLRQIKTYQTEIAPWLREHGLKGDCPYTPSCSEYGRQAIEKYGNVKGSVMAVKRVGRCKPGTKGGYDPVV